MTYTKSEKSFHDFNCDKCHYTCDKKSLWEKHCMTLKHLKTYQYLPKVSKSFCLKLKQKL